MAKRFKVRRQMDNLPELQGGTPLSFYDPNNPDVNLFNLIDEFWDEENKTLNLDPEDDIVEACVITREGAVVNETIKNIYSGA